MKQGEHRRPELGLRLPPRPPRRKAGGVAWPTRSLGSPGTLCPPPRFRADALAKDWPPLPPEGTFKEPSSRPTGGGGVWVGSVWFPVWSLRTPPHTHPHTWFTAFLNTPVDANSWAGANSVSGGLGFLHRLGFFFTPKQVNKIPGRFPPFGVLFFFLSRGCPRRRIVQRGSAMAGYPELGRGSPPILSSGRYRTQVSKEAAFSASHSDGLSWEWIPGSSFPVLCSFPLSWLRLGFRGDGHAGLEYGGARE